MWIVPWVRVSGVTSESPMMSGLRGVDPLTSAVTV